VNDPHHQPDTAAIPAWLEQPPTEVPPPVTVTAPARLPFGDLTPDNFERLVLAMARRTFTVGHAQQYGVPGQKQDGIDLYLRLELSQQDSRRYVTIQCRNIMHVKPNAITLSVNEFVKGRWADVTATFIFATRASTRRTELADAVEAARDRLIEHNVQFEVWDGDQLSERLRNLPDLVEIYFGRRTMELYCRPMPRSVSPVSGAQPQESDQSLSELTGQNSAQYLAGFTSALRDVWTGAQIHDDSRPDGPA
jgi:hypothetical protein